MKIRAYLFDGPHIVSHDGAQYEAFGFPVHDMRTDPNIELSTRHLPRGLADVTRRYDIHDAFEGDSIDTRHTFDIYDHEDARAIVEHNGSPKHSICVNAEILSNAINLYWRIRTGNIAPTPQHS